MNEWIKYANPIQDAYYENNENVHNKYDLFELNNSDGFLRTNYIIPEDCDRKEDYKINDGEVIEVIELKFDDEIISRIDSSCNSPELHYDSDDGSPWYHYESNDGSQYRWYAHVSDDEDELSLEELDNNNDINVQNLNIV